MSARRFILSLGAGALCCALLQAATPSARFDLVTAAEAASWNSPISRGCWGPSDW